MSTQGGRRGPALELKSIPADGIPHAFEKAERYRLLNDPEQAESICRDILAVEPEHQEALRMLVLSLTDQLGPGGHVAGGVREIRAICERLVDPYDRAYYTGIVLERDARAFLRRAGAVRSTAYEGFASAMDCYERAEALRPNAVDPRLRWNSCVRTILHEHLEPEGREAELPLE